MEFSRISITKKLVALSWTEERGHGTVTHEYESKDKPLPAFGGALQAFAGWALQLLGAPKEWDDQITVTTINLSEDKNGRRGIQVSISKRVEQANGASSSITTPLMREADNVDGEIATGYYGKLVEGLIEQLEHEASRYYAGEREQGEIFEKTEGAAKKDRKPTGEGRKPRNAGTPGEVMNPGAIVPPTDDELRQLLLRAGRDVPVDAIARWTSGERDGAQRWAVESIEATLNRKKPKGVEPVCVKRDGTLPLIQDQKPEAAAV